LAGAYVYFKVGTPTLWFIGLGLFFLLFYTWPLKYFGLGEISVVLVWGPLMVGGAYFVTSYGHWNTWIILISLVYALGPTTVLLGKHTDKLEQDKAKKVHTLPVIIGEKASRYIVIALFLLQYVFVGLLVYAGQLGPAMLVVLLSIPKLIKTLKVYMKPRPQVAPEGAEGSNWPLYLVSHAFEFNRRFGLLFLLGLVLDLIINKI
jgi:1,4-dihydroxy-2-naphthoate polyprenyltransferase